MTYLLLISGFFLHALQASLSYNKAILESGWGLYLSILVSNATGITWLMIARRTPDQRDILTYGTIWDSLTTLSFWVVPIFFFGVKLNSTSVLGLILVAAGTLLVKISG